MNIKVIKTRKYYKENRNEDANKKSINFTILFLCFTFFVGILLGTIYFKIKAEKDIFEESKYFIEQTEKIEVNKKEILIDSLTKNLIVLLFFWIVGLSIVGVPILIFYIIYEGFSVSIAIIYILKFWGFSKGYFLVYSSMYINTLLNAISIILLCNSAIRVTKNILRQKSDIKAEFIRHSAVCLIILIFFILLSLNEVLLSDFVKNNFT